ncbi:MAG TPA: VOC family protein [Candidatus Binatia bacterium]|jgi:catechol 2,3-dioxygenase-like lactoylglutathione lyase family enzyme
MSRIFGEVRQIAFVVRDLDAALRYWTETLGVGPFFVFRQMAPIDFRYRGKASPPPLLSIALGNSGDVQVELIEQHDDKPSAYRDFLASGREGLQHVSSWVTRGGYDDLMTRELAGGRVPAHEGVVPGANVRFAYFDTDSAPGGVMYEMSEALESQAAALMAMIADAARNWDGSEPIRELVLPG